MSGLEAILWFAACREDDEAAQRRRYRWIALSRGIEHATRGERTGPSDHLVQNDPEAIEIGTLVCLSITVILLGRGIARRAKIPCIVTLPLLEVARDTEVDQHRSEE